MGAVITGTHGGGLNQPIIAKYVTAMEMVTGNGKHLKINRNTTPNFQSYLINFGGLGIVTKMTMRIQPRYMVNKQIYTDMRWDELFKEENF